MTTTADAPTTDQHGDGRPVTDPIDLEVVRSRLEAIGEQACAGRRAHRHLPDHHRVQGLLGDPHGSRRGISSSGPGMVLFHFGAASHAVKATIARYGDTVAPGRRVLRQRPAPRRWPAPPGRDDPAADLPRRRAGRLGRALGPHDGHGRHGGRLLRPPGHRVLPGGLPLPAGAPLPQRRGDDRRLGHLRSTTSACPTSSRWTCAGWWPAATSAQEQVEAVVDSIGRDRFVDSLRAIRELTEAEMRRRILALEDGVYQSTSWTEYGDEFYRDPVHPDGRGRPHDLRLRRGVAPDGPLLQLQALHHRGRVPGHAGPPHRPRPAVQRGHLRPARAALPGGHDRQRQPAGADRGRPHARRAERGRRGHAGLQPGARRLARITGASATWPAPASSRPSATTCGRGSCPTAPPTPTS